MKNNTKVQQLVATALLAAIIIVLQTFASGLRIGPFTFTLALVPIIIGAVLYGPVSGAFLGLVFGIVVTAAVITGADVGGAMMLEVNPVVTIAVCLLKSTVAGFVAGAVYKALESKNKFAGILLAAILCPICNTGILCLAMLTVFRDLISGWALAAGTENVVTYVVVGVVGVNFIAELVLDLVLVPVIVRIIKAVRRDA